MFHLVGLIGQSHVRFNNYWDNVYSLNSASINDAYVGSLSMATRKQWVNFPGSPTTMFASGTLYMKELYTQIGFRAMTEKKGLTSSTDIDFTYAYEITLNSDWTMNLGLGVSYQNYSYDLSQISFATAESPEIYDRMLAKNNINAEVGVELNNNSWKFGASSKNLVSIFKPNNELYLNTNIAYALYRQTDADFVNVGVGVTGFQYSNMYQMELNLTGYFTKNSTSKPIQLGVFYRTWSEVGMIFGVELSKFKVSYSCDYNFGPVYNHSYGTHEIMLTYNFSKSYKCKGCWY